MVKYVITEMGVEGKIPETYENMRVLEAQIVALDAIHIPLFNALQENKIIQPEYKYTNVNNIIRDIICNNTGMCKC